MYFPTHPAGTTYRRLVSRSASPDTSTIPNPRYGSLSRFGRRKVRPDSFCEKCMRKLIKCKATGLGYFTLHFIHPFRRSDRSQTLTLTGYPRVLMVSRLCENGFGTPVMIFRMSRRDRWTASDNGSQLHARWPSTLIEKTPSLLFPVCRCTSRHSGRNPRLVRWGFSSYRISSSF